MRAQCCRVGRVASITLAIVLAMVTPTRAQVAVVGDLLEERTVAPGETYQGAVTLQNTTDTVQVVNLRLVDYRFDATGGNWFDTPGTNARSNSSWVALSQASITIAPRATQVVPYSVAVPTAMPPIVGTYWSVLLVEGEARSPVAPDPKSFSLTPRTRYAVQLATHVIGEARECRLGFAEPRIVDGEMAVDVSASDVRACRPNYRLEVYDGDGTLMHSATRRGAFLYPDTSTRQRFPLPPLAQGRYSFLLVADVGANRLQGAKYQIQVR